MAANRERQLMTAFVELADTMVDDYDVLELLDRLVAHCVGLDVADTAGIMLADDRGRLHVVASTDVHTEWIELLQVQAGEGPCVQCFHSGEVVSVADLTDVRHRWPRFAVAMQHATPYRSVCVVPMRLRGETVGTLDLFRRGTGQLDGDDLALGQALADVATIGILQERAIRRGEALTEQMQSALRNRVLIEQAKGALAERGHLDPDTAFTRLRLYARSRGRRAVDVAREVLEGDVAGEVLAVGSAVTDGEPETPINPQ